MEENLRYPSFLLKSSIDSTNNAVAGIDKCTQANKMTNIKPAKTPIHTRYKTYFKTVLFNSYYSNILCNNQQTGRFFGTSGSTLQNFTFFCLVFKIASKVRNITTYMYAFCKLFSIKFSNHIETCADI